MDWTSNATVALFAGISALDWVRYMSIPPGVSAIDLSSNISVVGSPLFGERYPSEWCTNGGRRAACKVLHASSCSYRVPYRSLVCSLDPAGFGGDYRVQVSVSGQESTWSTATFAYPSPAITSINTLDASTPSSTPTATAGGDLIIVRGRRLLVNSVTTVTVGGLSVSPLTSILPPDPLGRALVFAAPRGFGIVDVVVTVGVESAPGTLSYAGPTIGGVQWFFGRRADSVRKYGVSGTGISSCALCYAATGVRPVGCLLGADCSSDACRVSSECACAAIASTVNSASCALPASALAQLRNRRANLTNASALVVSVGSATSVITSAAVNDTGVSFVTSGIEGVLNVSVAGRVATTAFTYTALTLTQPVLTAVSPSTGLSTSGGSIVTLLCTNLGATGSVLLFTTLKNVNSLLCTFECPIVWSTKFGSTSAPLYFQTSNASALISIGLKTYSNYSEASAYVQSAGTANRLIYSSTFSSWVLHDVVPCFVVSWQPAASTGDVGTVTVSMPAWQGSSALSVGTISAGVNSSGTFFVSYSSPKVTSVSPALLPTSGGVVTITGSFGPAAALSDQWNSTLDGVQEGLLSGYIRYPALASTRSRIIVLYAQVSQESSGESGVVCTVLNWTAAAISCRLSSAVAGATYSVVVAQATGAASPNDFIESNSATIAFASPTLVSVWPAVQNSSGGLTYLLGSNFPADLSALDVWAGSVVVTPTGGLGLVKGSLLSVEVPFTGNNVSAVWFTMPAFEGSVSLRMKLSSAGAVVLSNNSVSITAKSPVIIAVYAASFATDPCAQVAGVVDNVSNVRSWTTSSTCVQAAAALYRWNYSVSASAPCFDALALGDVIVNGTGFGSGSSPIAVNVSGYSCSPRSHSSTSDSEIDYVQCTLSTTYDRGPVLFSLGIAYAPAVSSSAVGIHPRAACPCGYYAEADGAACVACPTGAICAGADLAAVAKAGYWRTIASEWISERNINPADFANSSIPLFVACPTAALCLAGQSCAAGSGGWMCTSCLPGYAKGSSSSSCFSCSGAGHLPSLIVAVVLAASVVSVTFGAIFFFFRRRTKKTGFLAKSKKGASGAATALEPKIDERIDAIVKAGESGSQSFEKYSKILISFLQTVSIFSGYLDTSSTSSPSSTDFVTTFVSDTACVVIGPLGDEGLWDCRN